MNYQNEVNEKLYQSLRRLRKDYKVRTISESLDDKFDLAKLTQIYRKHGAVKSGYHVYSIWFSLGLFESEWSAENCRLSIQMRNCHWDTYYTETKGNYKTNYEVISESLASDIADWVNGEVDRIAEQIAENNKVEYTDEVYDMILQSALKNVPENYTANWSVGKRQCDGNCEPYKALVVSHKVNKSMFCQMGTMVFGRNNFGELVVSTRVPLCGEGKRVFTLDNLDKVMYEEISFMFH